MCSRVSPRAGGQSFTPGVRVLRRSSVTCSRRVCSRGCGDQVPRAQRQRRGPQPIQTAGAVADAGARARARARPRPRPRPPSAGRSPSGSSTRTGFSHRYSRICSRSLTSSTSASNTACRLSPMYSTHLPLRLVARRRLCGLRHRATWGVRAGRAADRQHAVSQRVRTPTGASAHRRHPQAPAPRAPRRPVGHGEPEAIAGRGVQAVTVTVTVIRCSEIITAPGMA